MDPEGYKKYKSFESNVFFLMEDQYEGSITEECLKILVETQQI